MTVVYSEHGPVRVRSNAYASLQESLRDVTRQVEDLNWRNLSEDGSSTNKDLSYDKRKEVIERARDTRRRSPLAKQWARLLRHYVLGQGITVKAKNRSMVQRIVDEFWDDPVNKRTLTNAQSLAEQLDSTAVDGDLFLLFFVDDKTGAVQLGQIDAMFVEDIIDDPENHRVPLWAKVRQPGSKYDFENGRYDTPVDTLDNFVYYRFWDNEKPLGDGTPSKLAAGLLYQLSHERRGKFGESELAAALDWLNAHKRFMGDRATLSAAAASVAWKKKRMSSAAQVQTEIERLRSSLTSADRVIDDNPPPAAGSTIVENMGSNLEWVKTDTGGANADFDERKLRMMVGSALGIMNHYFGDEAQANLATATAMELPMLKTYEGWQGTVHTLVDDVLRFVLVQANKHGRLGPEDKGDRYKDREALDPEDVKKMVPPLLAPPQPGALPGTDPTMPKAKPASTKEADDDEAEVEDVALGGTKVDEDEDEGLDAKKPVSWYVDVDFPPIIQKDIKPLMESLQILLALLPQTSVEAQMQVAQMALTALNVNDIDEVMAGIFTVETMAARMNPMAMLGAPGMPGGPAAPGQPAGLPMALSPAAGRAQKVPLNESDGPATQRVLRLVESIRDAADAAAV